jgi:hypothetical protein
MAQEAGRKVVRSLGAAVLLALCAFGAHAAGKGPAWASLTADQQQVLAPLRADWDRLSPDRKRKWIGIAKRYPTMAPEEQQRVQRRMQAWAKLTTEQRWQARQQYRNIEKIAPDRRRDLRRYWAEYQALSPQEKRMFDVPPVETRADVRKRRSSPPRRPDASRGANAIPHSL